MSGGDHVVSSDMNMEQKDFETHPDLVVSIVELGVAAPGASKAFLPHI